jgi:hypothetical protein
MLEEATGELTERRLDHQSGEAHAFKFSVNIRAHQAASLRWAAWREFVRAGETPALLDDGLKEEHCEEHRPFESAAGRL